MDFLELLVTRSQSIRIYAPFGRYNTETLTLPIVGPVKIEAADNIGLGFCTNLIQGAATWYPWADRRMAVAGVLTYEIHGEGGFRFHPRAEYHL